MKVGECGASSASSAFRASRRSYMVTDILLLYSRRRSLWWHWPAFVLVDEGLPSRRQARPLRCRQHTWCHHGPVPHLLRRRKIIYTAKEIHAQEQTLRASQQIEGYLPADNGMQKAFTGADMVVIPAGIPRM